MNEEEERLRLEKELGVRELAPEEIQAMHNQPGAWTAGLEGMAVNYPGLENRRVRFLFTEKGWREVGRSIVPRGIREGHVVRVNRRKNPQSRSLLPRPRLGGDSAGASQAAPKIVQKVGR
jgi:hypothetical protein